VRAAVGSSKINAAVERQHLGDLDQLLMRWTIPTPAALRDRREEVHDLLRLAVEFGKFISGARRALVAAMKMFSATVASRQSAIS
jgi:hypothetical protein